MTLYCGHNQYAKYYDLKSDNIRY